MATTYSPFLLRNKRNLHKTPQRPHCHRHQPLPAATPAPKLDSTHRTLTALPCTNKPAPNCTQHSDSSTLKKHSAPTPCNGTLQRRHQQANSKTHIGWFWGKSLVRSLGWNGPHDNNNDNHHHHHHHHHHHNNNNYYYYYNYNYYYYFNYNYNYNYNYNPTGNPYGITRFACTRFSDKPPGPQRFRNGPLFRNWLLMRKVISNGSAKGTECTPSKPDMPGASSWPVQCVTQIWLGSFVRSSCSVSKQLKLKPRFNFYYK